MTHGFFCVSKNVSVSCACRQGKRDQFSGFNRTLADSNNVFRNFSAFHDAAVPLIVEGGARGGFRAGGVRVGGRCGGRGFFGGVGQRAREFLFRGGDCGDLRGGALDRSVRSRLSNKVCVGGGGGGGGAAGESLRLAS